MVKLIFFKRTNLVIQQIKLLSRTCLSNHFFHSQAPTHVATFAPQLSHCIYSLIYLFITSLQFSKLTMLLSSQFFIHSTLSSVSSSQFFFLSLEVKDDIFGIIDFVQNKFFFGIPIFTRMFQIFCFLVIMMYQIFWIFT